MSRYVLGAVGLCVLVALWWAAVTLFDVKPYVLPSPARVLAALYDHRGSLWANLLPTAIEAGAGFVVGNVVAVLIASAFVYHPRLQRMFFPAVLVLNSIPVVAKAPMLVLLLGTGMEPKVTIAALVCLFPTLVSAVRGLEAVPQQQLELMRVLSASKAEIFFHLRLRNSLPYVFTGLKTSASLCVAGAVVGEWVGTDAGLGALIIQATYGFDAPLLYAAVVMCAALTGLFFLLVASAERLVVRR